MKVILGGQFESALLRYLSLGAVSCKVDSAHSYYMGIYRARKKTLFDRSGTFLALSEKVIIPEIDWRLQQIGGNKNLDESDIGLEYVGSGFSEWGKDMKSLSGVAYMMGAFSEETCRFISEVPSPVPAPPDWSPPKVGGHDPWSDMNSFAMHYLWRLLLQVRTACESKSQLVLSDEDIVIMGGAGVVCS